MRRQTATTVQEKLKETAPPDTSEDLSTDDTSPHKPTAVRISALALRVHGRFKNMWDKRKEVSMELENKIRIVLNTPAKMRTLEDIQLLETVRMLDFDMLLQRVPYVCVQLTHETKFFKGMSAQKRGALAQIMGYKKVAKSDVGELLVTSHRY